jgi:hypothetical protein
MGEIQNQSFQLSFNASLKVDFQDSRVTSEAGEDGRSAGETCPLLLATAGRKPSDAAVSGKLMEQATTAGVQGSRKAGESRSDHRGERKCTERAWLAANGCILARAGMPKNEFRFRNKFSHEFKTEIPDQWPEGHEGNPSSGWESRT